MLQLPTRLLCATTSQDPLHDLDQLTDYLQQPEDNIEISLIYIDHGIPAALGVAHELAALLIGVPFPR
jgi:hypothetical protein